MRWVVLAPFLKPGDPPGSWLDGYVEPEHQMTLIPRVGEEVNWHLKTKPVSNRSEWWQFLRTTVNGLRRRRGGGVVTVFPQLAALSGLAKRLTRGRYPLVAYFFNTPTYGGWRGRVARFSLNRVDRFVVHSTIEAAQYPDWLGLPAERFVFVPLQKPDLASQFPCDPAEDSFVFATGSGFRDYRTFFEAVADLPCRVVVAPGRHAVAGLVPPSNVELLFDITRPELIRLSQQATVNVLPLNDENHTAGLVTLVEALRLGVALVVTDLGCVRDYAEDGQTALLVPLRDVDAMRRAITRLLDDPVLRSHLSDNARAYGRAHLSDEAAGAALKSVLDDAATAAGRD